MASVTYYVVVPFNKDPEGNLIPGEAKEAPNGDRARRLAQGLAATNAGAIAFSRTGDPDHGDFGDAQIVASFGSVDLSALGG
ncbi:hypothetical protein P7D22_15565 [Lichenihabitans sp. Uapishka_5]|uniref:hypothetical protein n=1 Tax=Lichenihabitans sp. Uapishka_5 TaxID=3037302 RepID=UPI0029E7F1CF|nr:hypothetical protein [Lichenihabitans sp. Uapishka_5]MDX7952588.1 hypothetical protein [Lichenihabitans sp. Uapishka_5]